MKSVYANLLGKWVRLDDDPECLIGNNQKSPSMWFEENAKIYNPRMISEDQEDSLYFFPHVWIYYLGNEYIISPSNIQVVIEGKGGK